jgi:hypothetical protein
MLVYSALVLFYEDGKDSRVLTTKDNCIPRWEITDRTPNSLVMVQDALQNITGISNKWPLVYRQVGTFEFCKEACQKELYVVYSVYLSGKQSVQDDQYVWMKMTDLDQVDDTFASIVRYIGTQRF